MDEPGFPFRHVFERLDRVDGLIAEVQRLADQNAALLEQASRQWWNLPANWRRLRRVRALAARHDELAAAIALHLADNREDLASWQRPVTEESPDE